MKKNHIEIMVGLFVLIGLLSIGYVSDKLGRVEIFTQYNHYNLNATFTSAAGLKEDVNVEISGVKVGSVKKIELKDNQALVTLSIENHIVVQEDAIASIKTKGLLGEKYISIEPGYSDVKIKPGGAIFDTEPSFDLEGVIKHLVVDDE